MNFQNAAEQLLQVRERSFWIQVQNEFGKVAVEEAIKAVADGAHPAGVAESLSEALEVR